MSLSVMLETAQAQRRGRGPVDLAAAARTLPVVSAAFAALGLFGWVAGVELLRALVPGRVSMQVQTAIALLVTSSAFVLRSTRRTRTGAVLSWTVVLFGVATLADYALHGASAPGTLGPGPTSSLAHSGRMAVQSAACLVLLGLATLLSESRSRLAAQLRECAALVVAFIAYVALVGHAFDARSLWVVATTHMAIGTAIALFALALATLLSGPRGGFMRELGREEEGGYVARRLLPLSLGVPVIVGWLRLSGEQSGHFETPDGATILVVTNAVLFAAATWWIARVANRVANERGRIRSQLHDTEVEREIRMRFVRALAHDLRAPLASIRVGTERLSRRPMDETDSKVSEVVLRGVERLDRMIRDLLDVERARAGLRLAVERIPGDAAAILEEIVGNARVVHGDRLVTSIEGPIEGAWDRNAIERIVENLVGNAFKYGAEDGIVTLNARRVGDDAVIAVHNTGHPLRPSEIPRLIEPFHRGADTRGRTGWGIGLPVVFGLCAALGGRMEIESDAERGTTFRVVLPVAPRGT